MSLLHPGFAREVGKVLGGETTCTIRQPGYSGSDPGEPAGVVEYDEFGSPVIGEGSTVEDATDPEATIVLEDIPCVVGEAPDKERAEITGDVRSVDIMLFRYVPKEVLGLSKQAVVTDAEGVETTYNIVDVNHDPLNSVTLLTANTVTT